MAYRYGNRSQAALFPACVEDYVAADAPVRADDAIVEALDLAALGIAWDPDQVGNSAYDPRAMLKLLVYGYSYGVRSSRKLERECHNNVTFMWLVGGLTPDHKTIAEYRRRHRQALKRVLGQCAQICVRLELIAGNVLFMDGSRLRANASIQHSWTVERATEALAEIEGRIERLLADCEAADQQEQETGSLVRMPAELQDAEVLRTKVTAILQELAQGERSSFNTTDPDCSRMHSRQGNHAGYTGQIVVDDQHGLIVQGDVVSANHDWGQFTPQLRQAHETLGHCCAVACADAGYAEYQDLAAWDGGPTDVIVPSPRQVQRADAGPFGKSRFVYDAEADAYRCPAGQYLHFHGFERERKRRNYVAGGAVCRACAHFGRCTTNAVSGRKVTRLAAEETRARLERRYVQADAQAIYRRRKGRVEHQFGHLKRNLRAGYFLLRGLAGVRAEWSLLTCAFNVARMIGMLGVPTLVARLAAVHMG